MSSEYDLLKRHPFELHARHIENPIEDYARHIRAFDTEEAEDSGVPLEKIFEELSYEEEDIEADLEYLTTAGFIQRELTEDGKRTYSLTEDAEAYIEEFRGKTETYKDMVDEAIRGDV